METPEKPKRRWYRKKRWWAAGLLWLALPQLYVLSAGPLMYVNARGWWEFPMDYCDPLWAAADYFPTFGYPFGAYVGWFQDRGDDDFNRESFEAIERFYENLSEEQQRQQQCDSPADSMSN